MIGLQPFAKGFGRIQCLRPPNGYEAGFSNYMSQGNICHGGLGEGCEGVGKRVLVEEMSVVFIHTVDDMSSGERVFQVCV